MSRFDDNQKYDNFLDVTLDKDNENQIEAFLNQNYSQKEIIDMLEEDNKKYFNFFVKENNSFSFQHIRDDLFQSKKNFSSRISFLLNYLKVNYGVVNSKVLLEFFRTFKENEEAKDVFTERELKNMLLLNFSKETINLKNDKDFESFSNFLNKIWCFEEESQ